MGRLCDFGINVSFLELMWAFELLEFMPVNENESCFISQMYIRQYKLVFK